MKSLKKFIFIFVLLFTSCISFAGCGNENIKNTDNYDSYLNLQGLDFYLLDNDTYGVKIGNATELSCITIPEKYCDKPVSVIMEDGFSPDTQLGEDCLYKVNKITISSNIEKIEKSAFRECRNLVSVEFAENSKLSIIEDNAFAFCSKLKNITLPKSLTYIGKETFYNTAITHIKIPINVDTIGEFAFCSSYKSNMCAGILCESSQEKANWDENWDTIYDYIYKPEDKIKGVPYFYRSDEEISKELNYDGHFWKYDDESKNIISIWGVSNNTWFVKYKYQIIDGEKYSV